MLLFLAFAMGAAIGWRRATLRGGDRRDKLQYGAVHGIAFSLGALILLVAAGRMGLL